MVPKTAPKCVECQKTESMLWRKVELGHICHECFEKKHDEKAKETEIAKDADEKAKVNKDWKDINFRKTPTIGEEKRLRKSTRATRFKSKATSATAAATGNGGSSNSAGAGSTAVGGGAGSGKTQSKGRNRRTLFKKIPYKAPVAQATTHTVQSVFYKGSYIQIGDIVSLVDGERNVYYAQIRGLLVDDYCEKSAFLTWLIPTQSSPDPNSGFDAATYLIGPDEDLSRKISCLEFVMHAPSNYYLDRTTPFPLPDSMELHTKSGGFIWTALPEYHRKKAVP